MPILGCLQAHITNMAESFDIPQKEKGFQSFSLYPGTSSIMVSNRLMHQVNCRIVQKYLPIDYFVGSITEHFFYMAAPSKWEDVFEMKYLEVLDNPNNGFPSKDMPKLKEMSIFCTCMTYNDSDNEEASWKSYDKDREHVIRVSYDFAKLCTILDKATDENIYIGMVDYLPRKAILSPMRIDCNNGDSNLDVLYVNNFCLKQDAYKYEKELRFCKIITGEKGKNLKEYKIEHIDVSPSIIKITLPPINYKRIKKDESDLKKKEQVIKYKRLKEICPTISIHASNLYDTSKEEMTSELIY